MANGLYPPGPKARSPLGHLLAFRRDPTGFLLHVAGEYGDLAHFRMGSLDFYLVNDPKVIEDVLVIHHRMFRKSRGLQLARRILGDGLLTSEGEYHLRQRRLAQPAFHKRRIAAYGEVMSSYARRTADRWRQLLEENRGDVDGASLAVDMDREMMWLTLAVVGKTLLDADVEDEADDIGEALSVALDGFSRSLLPFLQILDRLPLPSTRRYQRAEARLDATIYRLIAERRASGEDRGDLLSMLLMAQDEEQDGPGMTDRQVRDEAMTLFLAGHETTANALTWTWYLLSQNPEPEARLHEELDRVLGERDPTPDDVPHLAYTRMVLTESMRLYPPAYVLGRQALEDYPIGEYVVPAGATIFLSQYVTHHDPRFYPEPFRFLPERWETADDLPRFAYFPFGGGPRMCIGEGFAWMEGILVLATLARCFTMRLMPGQPYGLRPLITLRPRYGMRMILYPRRAKQPATHGETP